MSEGLQLDSRCHDSLIDRNLGSTHLVSFVIGTEYHINITQNSYATSSSLLNAIGLILILVALTLIFIIYLSKANSEVRRVYYVLPIYNVIVLCTRYYILY